MILVIDTETTGLPPRGKSPTNGEAWNSCRIVQIAWQLYPVTAQSINELVSSACYIIKPKYGDIPVESAKIHGITTERAMQEGVDIMEVISELDKVLPMVTLIVAHNIDFDKNVVASELHRAGAFDMYRRFMVKDMYCTMREGTQSGGRWPKLADLYERLHGEKVGENMRLHSADTDAQICAAIYFKQRYRDASK